MLYGLQDEHNGHGHGKREGKHRGKSDKRITKCSWANTYILIISTYYKESSGIHQQQRWAKLKDERHCNTYYSAKKFRYEIHIIPLHRGLKKTLQLVLSLTPIALLADWLASPPLFLHPQLAQHQERTVEAVLDVPL
jgi:hypothetical protein